MAKVTGIGGIFFKAKDPERLRTWYREVLGLPMESWGGATLWNEGKTFGVFTVFAPDTKYFEPSTKELMINLRVDDADGLIAQLKERGADVLDRREDPEDGKFRYVVDPEGTLLELWQPPG